jgi:DNA-binding NarL/FixJ family response regulator
VPRPVRPPVGRRIHIVGYRNWALAWVKITASVLVGVGDRKLEMSSVEILVVDDHPVVRRAICALLSSDPVLNIICQTSDGEQAVQKAEEVQPDLVLLDISLPGISGIEAARRIRRVSPKSRIIFLSQHDSLQMVKDAMNVGGYGYVAKIDAGSELLKAIRNVCEGKQFVSQRIVSQGWRIEARGGADA